VQIAKVAEGLCSLFYPAACAVCGEAVARNEYLCGNCEARAPRIVAPFCAKCSEPFSGAIDGEFTCTNCERRQLDFDAAVSAYRSRGIVRSLILQFKYHRALYLRDPIGRWVCEALADERLRRRAFDVVVPVPLHAARLRERGFNQADLLARILSTHMGVPVRPALERRRYTTTQTAFDRAERLENLRGAFRLREKVTVRDSRVLLVDDVLTTGSTLSECARVMGEAGADSVYAVTAARA